MASTPKRFKVITPVITQGIRDIADLRALAHAGLAIDHTMLSEGPSSIESVFEEVLAAPPTVAEALKAEADGYDAVIVDCFGDPGVQAARELLTRIPVFGPGECSMHAAALLSQRFSIVTVTPSVVPMLHELAHRTGVAAKLASVRVIDIPVLAMHGDMAALQRAMGAQACAAVREDGADVIVLGCTGFMGCAEVVQTALADAGLAGVPVIDPVPITVNTAYAVCQSGLMHSKRGWRTPSRKPIAGFDALQAALK
jgi:allantoin racemase